MNKWDERFSSEEFFYGEEPNVFFAEYISSLQLKGKLLLPAEGEGRNAVFAAKLGWQVHAFDSSRVARQKALGYAHSKKVMIDYECFDMADFIPKPEMYDMVALVFAHLKQGIRELVHQKLVQSLKKGGIMLVESFAKEQIHNNTGGPPDINMLYSTEMMKKDFNGLKVLKLCQQSTTLKEGHHFGEADVVRFIGQKL
ncbi:MAG: class I SAM-dependent methyltransferase [Bacteroidales bacterium]|nr:class I SAM-dependent methyltransferase [Bacteroidales bacterium]